MKKELFESFNAEVEKYRKALLFYAKKSEWDTFKQKAGSLFDYIESIEISESFSPVWPSSFWSSSEQIFTSAPNWSGSKPLRSSLRRPSAALSFTST